MDIIFMGSPVAARPSLKKIVEAGFNVTHVLTRPDKPKGRGNTVRHTPVKELALEYGIPVLEPARLKGNTELYELLKSARPSFFAVVAYGLILPREFLEIPLLAPVNLHFSLLPLYRGAAPINYAVLNGDEDTGASTMLMDAGMDTGDILLEEKTPIEGRDAETLLSLIAESGAELLVKTLLEFTSITPKPQEHERATFAQMLTKEMGRINWEERAEVIERKIRAYTPWPTSHTEFHGKLLKIYKGIIGKGNKDFPAGVVIETDKRSFTVQTGEGALTITEVQLEGKRRMSAQEFLSGGKVAVGERFD